MTRTLELAVLNAGGNADAGREAGAPMRVMAEMLAERGFDVYGPEREESWLLTIVNAIQARCEIGVEDSGRVFWRYFPWAGADTEPAEISGMVLRMLGAYTGDSAEQYAHLHRGATLKGAVAREIQARGLDADMEVYEDELFYDVDAEVILTNPAKPERGRVRVTDDGAILWECEHGEIPERAAAIADVTAEVLVTLRQAGEMK
jgi:hypothetical protein